MFDTRNVAKFAFGENLTGNHKHAIQKVVRLSLPPFAINTFEDRILEQISFLGHASAKEIGLTRFGTRYYNPALGRWTQQDPVGGSLSDLNSANRYTYANDDPVNVVDPSGKYSSSGALIACVVGGLTALGGWLLALLAPVILATGPAGIATWGAAIIVILSGCIVGILGYNLLQWFTGGGGPAS